MRKLLLATILSALVAFLATPQSVLAQLGQGTQTFWNGSRQDAATQFATSVTSAATITITPQAGQYAYVTAVRVSNCAGAAAVTAAGPTSITSTNLNGLTYQVGSGVTAGLCAQEFVDGFGPGGMRAAAPGAVTVVLPTFATNQTVRVSISWYSSY